MNETFNINRFRLLVRRQWAENKKTYILLWGVISLSMILITLIADAGNELDILNFWLFWLGGCAITATLFSRWTDSGCSSLFLLLPASPAEKFICGIFYGLILYIPVYCLNFLFVKCVLIYFILLPFQVDLAPFSSFFKSGVGDIAINYFHGYRLLLLTFLFAQSVFMIIVIRFKKWQGLVFLLTLLAILAVYNIMMKTLILSIAPIPAGTSFNPGMLVPHAFGFGYCGSSINSPVNVHFSFTRLIHNLDHLIWLVIFFILYLTAFYKLREREL